ncbi:MAG: carbohydrate kinase family protein [Bacteroidota bacterium]
MNTSGIAAAGNWIIDHVKIIDNYPQQEALSNILEERFGNGGSPYNILKNLAKLGANFPLHAVGLVGDDMLGKKIIQDCKENKIHTANLLTTSEAPTSYTDVMTVKNTGKRTFFHNRGANAFLDDTHIDFDKIDAKIFHLGYLLLLDKIDAILADGETLAAKLLKKASESGFETSIDIVSEASDRFKKIVPASLPYTDYLFINEYEASQLTGITIPEDISSYTDTLQKVGESILQMGVRKYVFLHSIYGVLCWDKQGNYIFQPALKIPAEKVVGSAGAGDALASGIMYGLHENLPLRESLLLGVSTAASCLFHPTCSGGILSKVEVLELGTEFGFIS